MHQTNIQFFRGNLAAMPLLSAGEPGFALDAGDLYVGNGVENVRVSGTRVSAGNYGDISVDALGTTWSLNLDVVHAWTVTQLFIAPTSGNAIVARAAALTPGDIQQWQSNAGTVLGRITFDGNFSNAATPTTTLARMVEADYLVCGNNKGIIGKSSGGSESTMMRLNASNVTEFYAGHEGNFLLNGAVALKYQDSPAGNDGLVTIHNDTIANAITLSVQHYSSNTHAIQAWRDSTGAVLTSIAADGTYLPVQAPTASAPTYVKGAMYFDTTLNKLRIGGAAGWETVTSV